MGDDPGETEALVAIDLGTNVIEVVPEAPGAGIEFVTISPTSAPTPSPTRSPTPAPTLSPTAAVSFYFCKGFSPLLYLFFEFSESLFARSSRYLCSCVCVLRFVIFFCVISIFYSS